jgi:hypothetical protein
MQESHCDLMDALLICIAVNEGFACEVAEIAEQCELDGNHAIAATMRYISRNHWIRGMESRANLAVLQGQHADIFEAEGG